MNVYKVTRFKSGNVEIELYEAFDLISLLNVVNNITDIIKIEIDGTTEPIKQMF